MCKKITPRKAKPKMASTLHLHKKAPLKGAFLFLFNHINLFDCITPLSQGRIGSEL